PPASPERGPDGATSGGPGADSPVGGSCAMGCTDPLLKLLKQYGYNIVRLPRAEIGPLQVLSRHGSDLDRFGVLTTILEPGREPPPIRRDAVAANVAGEQARTGGLGAAVGLPLLGNVIAAMGGSKLGLEAKYVGARTFSFEFVEVRED